MWKKITKRKNEGEKKYQSLKLVALGAGDFSACYSMCGSKWVDDTTVKKKLSHNRRQRIKVMDGVSFRNVLHAAVNRLRSHTSTSLCTVHVCVAD